MKVVAAYWRPHCQKRLGVGGIQRVINSAQISAMTEHLSNNNVARIYSPWWQLSVALRPALDDPNSTRKEAI
jgi:poly-D-alanine transfer protein DltD